jgi:hypothetical protein
VTAFRRLALGFPLNWSHRRGHVWSSASRAGEGAYYVRWDPGSGVYGEDWTNAPFDARGVLLSGPARHYHPIRIAQFALHRHDLWRSSGDPAARGDVLAQAVWLRDHQERTFPTGAYRFDFAWRKYAASPGWMSAMAQGEAISVLLRAHSMEGASGFDAAAERAALPFRHDIAQGGVVWRDGTAVFFEEIATDSAAHVLNGCIFALWGLWELGAATNEPWIDDLIGRAVATLRSWIARFDTGWWTRYSLLRSATGLSHVATLKYHQFHIAQMRVLAKMFDEPVFERAADRWETYVDRRYCRARMVGATLRSLPERFLGYDTVAGGART